MNQPPRTKADWLKACKRRGIPTHRKMTKKELQQLCDDQVPEKVTVRELIAPGDYSSPWQKDYPEELERLKQHDYLKDIMTDPQAPSGIRVIGAGQFGATLVRQNFGAMVTGIEKAEKIEANVLSKLGQWVDSDTIRGVVAGITHVDQAFQHTVDPDRNEVEEALAKYGWYLAYEPRELHSSCIYVDVPTGPHWQRYTKIMNQVRHADRVVGEPVDHLFQSALTFTKTLTTKKHAFQFCYDVRKLFFYVMDHLEEKGIICKCELGKKPSRKHCWCKNHPMDQMPLDYYARVTIRDPAHDIPLKRRHGLEPELHFSPGDLHNIIRWFTAYKGLVRMWSEVNPLEQQHDPATAEWRNKLLRLRDFLVPKDVSDDNPFFYPNQSWMSRTYGNVALTVNKIWEGDWNWVFQKTKTVRKLLSRWGAPFYRFLAYAVRLAICTFVMIQLSGTFSLKLLIQSFIGPFVQSLVRYLLRFVYTSGSWGIFSLLPDNGILGLLKHVANVAHDHYANATSLATGLSGLGTFAALGATLGTMGGFTLLPGVLFGVSSLVSMLGPTLVEQAVLKDTGDFYVEWSRKWASGTFTDDIEQMASLSGWVVLYFPQVYCKWKVGGHSVLDKLCQSVSRLFRIFMGPYQFTLLVTSIFKDLYHTLRYMGNGQVYHLSQVSCVKTILTPLNYGMHHHDSAYGRDIQKAYQREVEDSAQEGWLDMFGKTPEDYVTSRMDQDVITMMAVGRHNRHWKDAVKS